MSACYYCGTLVVFERDTSDQPPEYDICDECGYKCCPDCVSWKDCCTDGREIVCKSCAEQLDSVRLS